MATNVLPPPAGASSSTCSCAAASSSAPLWCGVSDSSVRMLASYRSAKAVRSQATASSPRPDAKARAARLVTRPPAASDLGEASRAKAATKVAAASELRSSVPAALVAEEAAAEVGRAARAASIPCCHAAIGTAPPSVTFTRARGCGWCTRFCGFSASTSARSPGAAATATVQRSLTSS